MSEQAWRRALEVAHRLRTVAIAAEARQRAQAAGIDRLALGWISSGGPVPWSSLPQTRTARRASRRERET